MNSPDLRLADLRRDVELCLTAAFAASHPASVYEPIRYVVAGGGKRLRPVLTVLSALAFRDSNVIYDKALQVGCAIEILHNFTLVHDDIMDRSSLRRGRETVHRKWNEATSILAGDTMLGIAYRLLIEAAAGEQMGEIFACFTEGIINVCEGQALDLEFQQTREISMKMYIGMIEKKTAKLLEVCAETGAITGGARDEQREAMREFARNLGVAFQIQDDILDLTASQAEFGKPIGNDLLEGKKTYLIVRAGDLNLDGSDAALLEKFYEKQGLSQEDIPTMNQMLERRGVLGDAQQAVELYSGKAAGLLDFLPDSWAKTALLDLTDALTGRRH